LDEVGSMTTADLARAEGGEAAIDRRRPRRLEQEGLVQRRPHPTDGRQVLFALTDQGVAIRRRKHHPQTAVGFSPQWRSLIRRNSKPSSLPPLSSSAWRTRDYRTPHRQRAVEERHPQFRFRKRVTKRGAQLFIQVKECLTMEWPHYASYFFGGAFLTNAVPHFVSA